MANGWQIRKFKKGDVVRLVKRIPQLLDVPKSQFSHPRTIIAIRYDREKQCSFYQLGSNARGHLAHDGNPQDGWAYWFRSYQLELYTPRPYHRKEGKNE
jgi:hypothetical protein